MAKARADYIIGELQRKAGDRPLLILMTSTHPMTDRNLCKTGHQIYNLDLPQFPIKWHREAQNTVPENMHIIGSLEELPHRPDVIISQNIVDQYNIWIQISQQFDCPVLLFEHTLPTEDWLKSGVVDQLAQDLSPLVRCFITEYSMETWKAGEKGRAIYHMVDTEKFSGWEGGNGKAMMLVNSFAGREWAVGDIPSFLDKIGEEKLNLFGINQGYKSQPLTAQQVPQALKEHDVFVNCSLRSPIPASLLEAASVGVPIVTRATCAIPKFFKDEENCLYFDTDEEGVEKVERLLGDRKLRKQLSEAARATVLEHFNEERYIKDWNDALKFAMENHYDG